MGPPLKAAENLGLRVVAGQASSRFNGAAAKSSGKYDKTHRKGQLFGGLQWGRR